MIQELRISECQLFLLSYLIQKILMRFQNQQFLNYQIHLLINCLALYLDV